LAFEDWFRRRELNTDRGARNVLLVDDSAFFRNMLTPVLKAAGYQVTTAPSASAALEMIEAGQQFDVVLTDIEMPGMTGFDLAASMRGDPRTAQVPIIALSSMVSSEAIERGREV